MVETCRAKKFGKTLQTLCFRAALKTLKTLCFRAARSAARIFFGKTLKTILFARREAPRKKILRLFLKISLCSSEGLGRRKFLGRCCNKNNKYKCTCATSRFWRKISDFALKILYVRFCVYFFSQKSEGVLR